MNIIVRMPNWIGDLVMATPVLIDLRAAFPTASITAMCRRPICAMLEKEPAIDELFCFTKPENGFLRRQDRRDILAKIRAGKYDVGILLTNSFSSAWWFWQGGVKRRIGFARGVRGPLLSDALSMPAKGAEHQVATYKRLLSKLGIPASTTAPRVFVSEDEMEASKELLYQRGYLKGAPLVGINVGATYGSAKCWPAERFRELAHKLLESKDLHLLFFGDSASAELVREITRDLPERAMNLAGLTHLRELICLIKDCTLLITNDSGPMHIADAVQTPLIALFGSTDERATGPYTQPEAVIHKHPACSPCFKRICPIDLRCMRQISVEEVVAKANACLKH